MIHQQNLTNKEKTSNIYHFLEYKSKRPFFLKPIKITIDVPVRDTFYMVKNVVYKEKQILALKKEQDPNTIVLVEAKIENGQLSYVSRVPEEYINDITRIIAGTI